MLANDKLTIFIAFIFPPWKVLFAAILDGLNKNVNGYGKKLKPPLDKSRAATEGMTALIAVVGRGRWFVIKKHCGNRHDNQGNSYPTYALNCATDNLNCLFYLFSLRHPVDS